MIGSTLAHYEVSALLGEGGMGRVYEATDLKLGRRVAVKVLPEALARDGDRIARLEREARLLASLNHPRIATIHGLEHVDGRCLLVMELVPGETLAERMRGRALPLMEALRLAAQIAGALEAAHDAGIIHRDLKPANIKVTPDGDIKLLDFGLAKVLAGQQQSQPADAPTRSEMATAVGVILGTTAYMSPEQARGAELDRRTDVFSFGCVLFEMLAGDAAFDGKTDSEIVARLLEREPDWARLPSETPRRIRTLLERCLQKDLRQRKRDSGDIRLEIEQVLADPLDDPAATTAVATKRSARPAWTVAALLAIVLPIAVLALYEREPASAREMRLQIVTPATTNPAAFALSPDGRFLVFVASGDGAPRLWLRPLDQTEAQPLPGTEEARDPFWSADSRSIGFFAPAGMMRIDVGGGRPRFIVEAAPGYGASWRMDGTILFAPSLGSELFRVSADGGEITPVTAVDRPRQAGHGFPQFLPDGRRFLFYSTGTSEARGIYLGSLDDPASALRITDSDAAGIFVEPDWLLFPRQGALLARRFDPDSGALSGDAVVVSETVGVTDWPIAAFSASANGLIAFRASADVPTQLTWFDRQGRALGTVGPPEATNLRDPVISPDGARVAVTRTVQGNTDVWLVDGGRIARLTSDAATDRFPVWSVDGSRIVFASQRDGPSGIFEQEINGGAETALLSSQAVDSPTDVSPDGRYILYFSVANRDAPDIWALPLPPGEPMRVVTSPYAAIWGQFSPNGRWVIYQVIEAGRWEIFLREFPAGRVLPISTAGGAYPRWAPDGQQVYYLAPNGMLTAVPMTETDTTISAGEPIALFRPPIVGGGANVVGRAHQYDVGPDGRFLVNAVRSAEGPPPITLVVNWQPR